MSIRLILSAEGDGRFSVQNTGTNSRGLNGRSSRGCAAAFRRSAAAHRMKTGRDRRLRERTLTRAVAASDPQGRGQIVVQGANELRTVGVKACLRRTHLAFSGIGGDGKEGSTVRVRQMSYLCCPDLVQAIWLGLRRRVIPSKPARREDIPRRRIHDRLGSLLEVFGRDGASEGVVLGVHARYRRRTRHRSRQPVGESGAGRNARPLRGRHHCVRQRLAAPRGGSL
jgi:hypothetical protein